MADVHSKEIRSYNMSRIKGRDTKPEMLVRKFLHAHGFRYRLHLKNLPGKPDIVLPKYKNKNKGWLNKMHQRLHYSSSVNKLKKQALPIW
jgi:DNA mismatch endonuclease Vsr